MSITPTTIDERDKSAAKLISPMVFGKSNDAACFGNSAGAELLS